jgi:predicted nucleic acid-binding protein
MRVAVVTAVDTSVLLDILTDDAVHRDRSLGALQEARRLGALIVCPVVWAEVRGWFPEARAMVAAFDDAGLAFDPFDRECADLAGRMWREYRRRGGTRTRLVPDFLVGAHAQLRGGRLLTRDRGFYRRFFSQLQVIGA